MRDEFVSKSSTKDEEIELSCQIALRLSFLAQRIVSHGKDTANQNSFNGSAVPVRVIQYNVQTLKDVRGMKSTCTPNLN